MLTHVIRFHSFLWLRNILLCVYNFTYVPSNRHVGCLHSLANLNNVAMNVRYTNYFLFSLGNTQKWNSWQFYFNFFEEHPYSFPQQSLTSSVQVFSFLHILTNTCYLLSFLSLLSFSLFVIYSSGFGIRVILAM